MESASDSHRRVEPSMSVNRKVTTPQGLGATTTWCHDSHIANRLSPSHLREARLHHPEVLVDRVLQRVGMRLGFRRLDVRQRLDSLQRLLFDLSALDVALQFVGLLLGGT